MQVTTFSKETVEDEVEQLLDGDTLPKAKLRRAERMLKKILESDPNWLAAHFHLARIYRILGQYKLALRHARRTLRLNPSERNARLNLGLIYDLMGRDDLAVLHYKEELARHPGSAETLWNIGRLYFRKHSWRKASKYLRRCFDSGLKFEMEDTADKLGICYHKLGDISSYIDVFTTYVQIVPNSAWGFANLGRALLAGEDYKHAALRLSRAKQLGVKKSVDVALAQARQKLGRMNS